MTLPLNQVFVNGTGQVSADNLNTLVSWCDTVADLRNFVGIGTMAVYLEGINSPNDGGQGVFSWSAAGTNPDDNGVTTVIPNGSSAGNGEWIRQKAANNSLVPSSASGANAITITPLADTTPITAYANNQLFGFVAAANSTGPVTANVAPPFLSAPLAFLNVYQPSGTQAGSGAFTAGLFYILAYVGSLNSNAGGFQIISAQTNTTQTAIEEIAKQTFSSTGTYTPTVGMLFCIIECWGPGGGGGGTATAASSIFSGGGGGGSGGYSKTLCTAAQIGVSKAVTISAAGTGAAAGNNAGGNAAGATSVGSLCIANGGSGGGGNPGTSGGSASQGSGGTAGTGDVTLAGFPGTYGTASTQAAFSGQGGGPGGGAGTITGSGSEANGSAATGIGGGGGGGMSQNAGGAAAGGNGGAGFVLVTEYLST